MRKTRRWLACGLALGLLPTQLVHAELTGKGERNGLGEPTAKSKSMPLTYFWNDHDADGRIDVLVFIPGSGGHLLRNSGNGEFEDVTFQSGLLGSLDEAFQAAWTDIDGDLYQDLFLASYSGQSHLMRQTAAGSFQDVTLSSGLPLMTGVVNAEWIMLEDDGRPNLLVSTVDGDRYFKNSGGSFQQVELMPGIGSGQTLANPPDSVQVARTRMGFPALPDLRNSMENSGGSSVSELQLGPMCVKALRTRSVSASRSRRSRRWARSIP